MTLTLDLGTSFKFSAQSAFDLGHLWVEYELDWTMGRESMIWTRIFHINSAMTITLRPKNLIKVTAHPSPKGTLLWVKFGPDWVKGREICSGQVIADGRTEKQIDGQIDHYKSPTEWGPSDGVLHTSLGFSFRILTQTGFRVSVSTICCQPLLSTTVFGLSVISCFRYNSTS